MKISELIDIINNIPNDILICGHKNADYDSMCSTLAFAYGLRKLGKNAKVYIELKSINKIDYFDCKDILYSDELLNNYTFVAMDLNRISRLPDEMEEYYKKAKMTINIDHHNGNNTNANFILSDSNIGSTCEMVYNIFSKMNIKIDKKIAELIFTGMITDTNLFSCGTTSKTFLIASKLVNYNIDSSYLINKFYLEKTNNEFNIILFMINNIKYDKFHYIILDMENELFKDVSYSDISKQCISFILNRHDIEFLVVIMDYGDKKKGEIRSKTSIDASKLAELLTGGGHTNAAGFSNQKSIDEIINICKIYLENNNGNKE